MFALLFNSTNRTVKNVNDQTTHNQFTNVVKAEV